MAGQELLGLCARLDCDAETALQLLLNDQPSYDGDWDLAVDEVARRHDVDRDRLASLIANAQWGAVWESKVVGRVA